MTTISQAARMKNVNETGHRRAMANPRVLEMVSNLRQGWAAMDLVERGERLRELTVLGCSIRGLQLELKQSATSIRRHMKPAELPRKVCDAQAAGPSAQKAVDQRANAEHDGCQRQRVIKDEETGTLSDEVATVIPECRRAEEGLPETSLLTEQRPLLISNAEKHLSQFEASGRRPVRVPEEMDQKGPLRTTRLHEEQSDLRSEHPGKLITEVVRGRAPERPIGERALSKVVDRAGELTPPRLKVDPYRGWEERVVAAMNSTVKPHRDPEVSALGRQGRPTTPPKRP